MTNCPNKRTISQYICTLFARYLHSSLCSLIMSTDIERQKAPQLYKLSHKIVELSNVKFTIFV